MSALCLVVPLEPSGRLVDKSRSLDVFKKAEEQKNTLPLFDSLTLYLFYFETLYIVLLARLWAKGVLCWYYTPPPNGRTGNVLTNNL